MRKTLIALTAFTLSCGFAVAQRVPNPGPVHSLIGSSTWKFFGDDLQALVSCDNFKPGVNPTREQMMGSSICVILACPGFAVASKSGYNDEIAFHRMYRNRPDKKYDPVAMDFMPKLSATLEREVRYTTWNDWQQTIRTVEGSPDYIRFSFNLNPDRHNYPVTYHFGMNQQMTESFHKGCNAN